MPRVPTYVPSSRSRRRVVEDVVHQVVAVGSRNRAKAQEFIDKFARGDKSVKAYGTYEEVYADKVGVLGNR
jgi:predicted dehydrogenase